VDVPASDPQAWSRYTRHRWIYNKLEVALSQKLDCAPYGVEPPAYPVFCKPVMNLHGMGWGSAVLNSERDYDRHCKPGFFWMKLLEGEHVSSDVALVNGRPQWWRHAVGRPGGEGMFDYWTIYARPFAAIEDWCGAWLARNLEGFSGMVNLETIGARIIELHLRMTDQWPDIYGGRPWIEALIGLYEHGRWQFDDSGRREGFSVALFGPHDRTYRHPPADVQRDIRAIPGVSSLQITFHESRDNDWHSNPPGGFRLAIVNCFDLEAGCEARRRLAAAFKLDRVINASRA
jgi:hypothetical protein